MAKKELVDAGCFISQMNELLLIDPLYINDAITNYFNNSINDKKALLPKESLNGIYFRNAKAGLWSSFAIRENNKCSYISPEIYKSMKDSGIDRNDENETVLSFICFNNTEFMHEYLTVEKINELKWEILGSNSNHITINMNKEQNKYSKDDKNASKKQMDKEEIVSLENYFSNMLTVESGQVGLFCIESIKHCADMLLQKFGNNDINNEEQLDNLFKQNMNDLYPWYNKICNLTLSSSIAIIDFIDMPIGSVCMSSADCVVNYLCEVVRDEVTDEVWAIRVNFLNPLK
ncbi:conserved Plasmodium protein, unknown function [Plasmodium malariae]|uniref:Uncharacterized protein n=1 Tax=Plasmodium malariae TaxID=5858 RepID=A0A1C3KYG9_PLAMA|nr:conserved Plasmodium protein, unknown function [Plasmodium malariae]